MKRIVCLILAACLLLCLAACGAEPGQSADKPESTAPAGTGADSPLPAEFRGTKRDDAYENELLNLRVALPAGWTFATDEQIAEVNGITADRMAGSAAAELIKKNGQLMDMMMSTVSGSSVNLLLQPQQKGLDAYSDEMVFQLAEESTKAQFAAANMSVETYEAVTVRLGSGEKTALHMVLNASGLVMDEYQIWFRTDGDYMGVLTVAMTGGAEAQPILDGITSIH